MTLNVTQFREILWHQKGGVLMLSLNRPDKRNAINSQMLAELIFALESCAFDDSIRAVVIQGSGKGFCPGDDLSGMGELSEDYVSALQHPVTHAALQSCLRDLPKPTIAAIHGYAFGVGLDLAMACDFRIVQDDAQLRDQRVIERGMHAVTGCAWFQPRAIGVSRALEFLILGKSLTGREAAEVGMVTESASEDDFEKVVADMANRLANAPTKAIGLMKKQIYTGLNLTHEDFMDFAAPLIDEITIEDRREGISAFLEKRTPKFTGH